MKFLIIGAGGTGGSIGGFLASIGEDVTFISRGKTLKSLQQNGLVFRSGIKGDLELKNIKVVESEDYSGKADVIFVCVKSYSLDEIIPFLKKVSNINTVIIPILNGIGAGEHISEKLETGIVLEGCIYIIAHQADSGEFFQIGKAAKIIFGPRRNQSVDLQKLEEIRKILDSSGIKTFVSDDIERDAFQKFTFISTYAACAVYYNIKAAEFQQDTIYRQMFIDLNREILAVAEKKGIKFNTDVLESNLKIIDNMLPFATASIQKDIEKGGKTEIEGLVYYVVKMADELGVNVPNYRRISEDLKKRMV